MQTALIVRRLGEDVFLHRESYPPPTDEIVTGTHVDCDWTTGFAIHIDDHADLLRGISELLLEVLVLYKDANGVTRRTEVLRTADLKKATFVKLHPDDERAGEDFEY